MTLSACLCRLALAGLPGLTLAQDLSAAEYQARLAPGRPLALSTPVSGVVSRVAVRPGQLVKQGELLLELDQRLFNARVKRARAGLDKTRQDRDEARRELDRTQEMFDRTLLSQHDLQLAQVAAASATANFQAAQAALEEASLEQEYSRLRAPFAARVVSVSVQPAQTLVHRFRAVPLVTLVPTGYVRALASVEAERMDDLHPGQAVSVLVDDDTYSGEVDALTALPRKESAVFVPGYRVEVRFTPPGRSSLQTGRKVLIRTGE